MKKDKKQQKKQEKVIADLDEWPYYIDRDGWLPADQYEDVSDEELQWTQRIIKHQTADFLRDLDIDYANAQIHADITYLLPDEQSTRQYGKILMPEALRTEAIRRAHGVGHYGQRRTRNKVAQEYYWPSLAKDVYNYVKSCPRCQRNKAIRAPRRDYLKFPVTNRLKTLHMDIVGPLPAVGKKRFIITMIDRFTRWVEAVPVASHTADVVIRTLFQHWIVRFGVPYTIVTDQGAEFESREFQRFTQYMGIKRARTTSYHPQANGIIERMHATLKAAMRCMTESGITWVKALPTCLLGLRTAVSDWGVSPSLVMYGEQISIPGMVVHHIPDIPDALPHELVSELQKESEVLRQIILANDKTLAGSDNLQERMPKFPTDFVLLREPVDRGSLNPRYRGPFKIVKIEGPNVVIWKEGKQERVNADRCRPYYTINYQALDVEKLREDPPPQEINKMMKQEQVMPECQVQLSRLDIPGTSINVHDLMNEDGEINFTRELEEFILSIL